MNHGSFIDWTAVRLLVSRPSLRYGSMLRRGEDRWLLSRVPRRCWTRSCSATPLERPACGRSSRTSHSSRAASRSRWPLPRPRRAVASSRRPRRRRSPASAMPRPSTSIICAERPTSWVIRSCRWSISSPSSAARPVASSIGAPRPRTSWIPPSSSRCARACGSWQRIWRRCAASWPISHENTATRRWPAAPTCSTRCPSPSATRSRSGSPCSTGTPSAWNN